MFYSHCLVRRLDVSRDCASRVVTLTILTSHNKEESPLSLSLFLSRAISLSLSQILIGVDKWFSFLAFDDA